MQEFICSTRFSIFGNPRYIATWQDESGNTKYITEVRANTFRLLRSEMNGNKNNGQASKPNTTAAKQTADASDDLPF